VRKLNVGLPLIARKTVWVYKAFWAKIKQNLKRIYTRLKQNFLFIYLFIIIILLLLLFRQRKKTKEKNYLFFFIFYF